MRPKSQRYKNWEQYRNALLQSGWPAAYTSAEWQAEYCGYCEQFKQSGPEHPEVKRWLDSSKFFAIENQPYIGASHVLDYVKEIHPDKDDFTRPDAEIEPNITQFRLFKLVWLPLGEIDLRQFHVLEELVSEYAGLITPFPPVVFDPVRKAIIDGMHRVNAAKRRGDKGILALMGCL